jgi:hypothetical protein
VIKYRVPLGQLSSLSSSLFWHSTLRGMAKECKTHINRSGNLKSRKIPPFFRMARTGSETVSSDTGGSVAGMGCKRPELEAYSLLPCNAELRRNS